MALSAAHILKLLHESQSRVKELESREPEIRIVEKIIDRVVEVPVRSVEILEKTVESVVYVDNPEHIETINKLKERLCQYTSQSDS